MFTGIIKAMGTIAARELHGEAGKLHIKTAITDQMQVSDSIAVNGTCLTVEKIDAEAGTLGFHTLAETLDKTNLGALDIGQLVNLERPLSMGEELGGHLVMGHVDGTAKIVEWRHEGEDVIVEIELPEQLAKYAIPKGSIAMDGISLTVAELGERSFTVCIIPYTWDNTNIQEAAVGKPVNLEMDMVGKYILRWSELEKQNA